MGEKICIYLLKLVANKLECFVDGIGVTCDSDNAFWTRSIADVDLGTTLNLKKVFFRLLRTNICM
jgi:hypothetical protein